MEIVMRCRRYWVGAVLVLMMVGCGREKEKEKADEVVTERAYEALSLEDLGQFREPGKDKFRVAGNVFMDRNVDRHSAAQDGKGALIVPDLKGQEAQLSTALEHDDLDLKVDFMLAKGSTVRLLFQGRYGIVLTDSWRGEEGSAKVCGVVERSSAEGGNNLPLLNTCKAPGLWQHLYVRFKAAQYNASGEKISSARFEEVRLNGKIIQKDVEVDEPAEEAAKGAGALVIAGGDGPAAFRNIQYKAYGRERIILKDIQFSVYKGLFRKYDTLKHFTPLRTGKTDTLHWASGDERSQIVFAGGMDVPATGDYVFAIRAGGPAWLLIDDREVVSNKGTRDHTHTHFGSISLEKGAHTFQVIYANYDESLVVEYEGPGIPFTYLTTRSSERLEKEIPPFEYKVSQGATLQRGFFMHRGKVNTYAVCVGTPEGLHYAYDLATNSLLSGWRGRFIDVSNMWTERGESQREIPLGAPLEFAGIPCVLQLADVNDTWTDTVQVDNSMYTQRGYKLNGNGLPEFFYSYKDLKIRDQLVPLRDGSALLRNVSVTFDKPGDDTYFLLGSGTRIEELPDGSYAVDDKEYYIEFPVRADEKKPLLVTARNGRHELLFRLSPATGNTLSFQYAIIW
jgi:hypothetical protein